MPKQNIRNKCDYCGLRTTILPETGKIFKELRDLYDKKIITQRFERRLYPDDPERGDVDEFCLLSKPEWKDRCKSCDSWQLETGLDKSDYISIHYAKVSERLTRKSNLIAIIALFFSVVAIANSLWNYILNHLNL